MRDLTPSNAMTVGTLDTQTQKVRRDNVFVHARTHMHAVVVIPYDTPTMHTEHLITHVYRDVHIVRCWHFQTKPGSRNMRYLSVKLQLARGKPHCHSLHL